MFPIKGQRADISSSENSALPQRQPPTEANTRVWLDASETLFTNGQSVVCPPCSKAASSRHY